MTYIRLMENTEQSKSKFTLRIPPNLRQRLQTLADKRETTLTALILDLIRQQLDSLGE